MRGARALFLAFALATTSPTIALAGEPTGTAHTHAGEAVADLPDHVPVRNREAFGDAVRYVVDHPKDFGGASFDEAGVFHILAVDAGSPAVRDLLDLVPNEAAVSIEPALRSTAELHAIRDTVIDLVPDLEAAGARVAFVSVDHSAGEVILTVESPHAIGVRRTELGPLVRIAQGQRAKSVACADRYNCTPWRGGIYIEPLDGVGLACSWGFNARSNSTSQKYMITAGHCNNETWVHDGSQIGTTSFNNMTTLVMPGAMTYADAQRVPVSSALSNTIYVNDTTKTRPITSIRGFEDQVNGDSVCASGWKTGYRCGLITDNELWYCINRPNGTVACMWGVLAGSSSDSLVSVEGDSGGPVFINYTALGIISARANATQSVYAPIDLVYQAVSIRLCLNSACS